MKEIEKHLKLNWRLLKLAWKEEKIFLSFYYLTSLLGVVLMFSTFYLYQILIDQVFGGLTQARNQVIFVVVATYLFNEYLSRFVYSTVNLFFFEYLLRSRFQNLLTRIFCQKLADLDFTNLENGKIRNLIAKVEDTYTWRLHHNLTIINYLIFNISALILSFLVALKFNIFYLIILAFVSLPLYYVKAKYGNIYWSNYSSHAKDTNYLWYLRSLFHNFQTLAEIKIYQTRDFFLKKIKDTQERLINEYKKPIEKYTLFSGLISIAIPLVIYFAVGDFLEKVFAKKFTIGEFTFFLNTLFNFSSQISNLLLNIGSIYENNLYVEDYFRLLDIKNKTENQKTAVFFKDKIKTIEFKDVFFSYPDSKKLTLKKINFCINKSENVAFVGHNGAGKTTIIKLLLRFYDPNSGQILINGIDLRKINLDSWYDQVGILFQDFAKYYFTLKENITIGRILQKENIDTVKNCLLQAEGFDLLNLPKGLDQILGRWFEEGEEISVGQWQKVAIARALYRNPNLLILDEPTSNIDPEAEQAIFDNLNKIYQEKNLIFVSHRFSTVWRANKIFVVDKGEIIESGTHQHLIKKNGLYAKFFKIQKKGYQ